MVYTAVCEIIFSIRLPCRSQSCIFRRNIRSMLGLDTPGWKRDVNTPRLALSATKILAHRVKVSVELCGIFSADSSDFSNNWIIRHR